MKSPASVLVLLPLLFAVGSSSGTHPWEWAATFKLPEHKPYQWIFQRVNGKYADATMTMAWSSTADDSTAGLEAMESNMKTLFKDTPTNITNGETVQPDVFYKIHFDQTSPNTILKMNPDAGITKCGVFMQHFPIEFEDYTHYLLDQDGTPIEPTVQDPPPAPAPGPVDLDNDGKAYLASFLATLVSLIGVITSSAGILNFMGGSDRFRVSASAFASGALLFCAFSLIFPEGLYKFTFSGISENKAHGLFAMSIAIGVLTCIALEYFAADRFTSARNASANGAAEQAVVPVDGIEDAIEGGESKTAVAKTEAPVAPTSLFDTSNLHPVVVQVIVGDFFHNFVDGIIIGSAFKSCSTSAGWTVTAGTVYHEMSQEIADFLVLTTTGNMSFAQAVLSNFLSATGCIIGTIVVNETNPDKATLGGLLCFGGAIYVFIALAQLQWWTEKSDKLRNCFLFFLGCLGIGLVLISHEHCTPAGAAVVDPHAGHNH